MQKKKNIDERVVSDFGHEWSKFNHVKIDSSSLKTSFESYFSIFPFEQLPEEAEGFDMGCGTGRWAKFVAPMVYKLNCIDPSSLALNQARDNLSMYGNCVFECSNASENSLEDSSQDFGYSLGVLHHTPDTYEALESCAKKLKPGAPFLLYLYYSMDNKPSWYKLLWRVSNLFRKIISKLPFPIKYFISQVIGLFVYFPLARTSLLMEKLGFDVQNFPLSDYRSKRLYMLRTDALDRFGTRLEHRFSQREISDMLKKSGFSRISFSEKPPFWTALAYRISD
jgi:SAM-dependent methyltransferase